MGFFSKLKTRLFGNKKMSEEDVKKQANIELNKKLIEDNKLNKYVAGMKKTNFAFSQRILEMQNRHNKIDEAYFDELEELLVMSDISLNLVEIIIDQIKKEVKNENISDPKLIGEIIVDKLFTIYANNSVVNTNLNLDKDNLSVIMMVGVNGTGKTTSIAKIANQLKKQNKKVLIAAADTFRAAAIEQLNVWAQRVQVDIVIPNTNETDPASVVFRSLVKAKEEQYDVLIIDTAGRLQNKVNLMQELKKMTAIIEKHLDKPADEVLLTIDSTTGQNGVNQAKEFSEIAKVTGIILTKLDGTSKGGIVFSIKDDLGIDVKFVGLGEQIDDLQQFDLDAFVYSMFKDILESQEN